MQYLFFFLDKFFPAYYNTTMEKRKLPLSGNLLKIIAALSMTLDHIGVMIFPQISLFRILGRLAFPIFAFFIAEGCRYTKNRGRYLGTMAGMAAIFQIVYFFAMRSLYMSVFVTFSLSILLIYLLDICKKTLSDEKSPPFLRTCAVAAFLLAIGGVYLLNEFLQIDYGFLGCLTPLFASLFVGAEGKLKRLDSIPCRALAMAMPLVGLPFVNGMTEQWYAFLALLLLLLYNGERGKYKMKYFFYIFYPAHLVIIYAISYLL